MSEGTVKELMAVVEVVHAYFQELVKEKKKNIKVSGVIAKEGIYAERAIDLSVTITPGNLYSADEVNGNWVSAGTIDLNNSKAQDERKQLHPDTVYAALCILMQKGKIRDGGLGYYQLRTKANSMTTGQPLAAASHNPTYTLPIGPNKKKWLLTSYKESRWYGKNMIKSEAVHNVMAEEEEFSDINSHWYKSAARKNVSSIGDWVSSGILPKHLTQKIDQLRGQSSRIDWDWIPDVSIAYAALSGVQISGGGLGLTSAEKASWPSSPADPNWQSPSSNNCPPGTKPMMGKCVEEGEPWTAEKQKKLAEKHKKKFGF